MEGSRRLERLAEFGLRSIWSYPRFQLLFCDLRSLHEIEEAVVLAGQANPDSIDDSRRDIDQSVRDEYLKTAANPLRFMPSLHALS